MKYRFADKEKLPPFRIDPKIGLKEARALRTAGLKLVASGVDPSEDRKAIKAARVKRDASSFEVMAREWFRKFSATWVSSHRGRTFSRFDRDIFPKMGG